jgi:hypothetical protein
MSKQILVFVIAFIIIVTGYVVLFKIAVDYVWPGVKQQVIEILQEGRK